MASPDYPESADRSDQPARLATVIEAFRVRGYLTLSVRIGYERVLIVSGSSGEAAIIDLSREPSALWNDAWAGMRQVLPRVPVVAVVPKEGVGELTLDGHVSVTKIADPVEPHRLVEAVEKLLAATSSGF